LIPSSSHRNQINFLAARLRWFCISNVTAFGTDSKVYKCAQDAEAIKHYVQGSIEQRYEYSVPQLAFQNLNMKTPAPGHWLTEHPAKQDSLVKGPGVLEQWVREEGLTCFSDGAENVSGLVCHAG
jgi:hypothetical protein